MKRLLVGVLVGAALVVAGLLVFSGTAKTVVNNLGQAFIPSNQFLAGSTSNAVSLPRSYSFSNSTTTDATNTFAAGAQVGFLDGGATIQQSIETTGINRGILFIGAKAGTATSTFSIRQQASFDNTNFYDIDATSTSMIITGSLSQQGTSTIPLNPHVVSFDPGIRDLATTTWMIPFNTYGAKFTRFLFTAEDLTTDPADGVQAWVQASLLDELVR